MKQPEKLNERTWGKIPITLYGCEIYLIGSIELGGAIATERQFANFEESFAHLWQPSGIISRYGQAIGTVDDITLGHASDKPVR